MRVLVTGGSGFIGRHCVAALEAVGCEVHSAHPNGGLNYQDWRADLLREGDRRAVLQMARPQIIVACSWTTEHGKFWNSPANTLWRDATLDLFLKAKALGVRRFVGVGSCAEYTGGDGPLAETAECNPVTLYGLAKDHCRRLIADADGMAWAWARVFMPIGIGEPAGKLVSAIARQFAQEQPVELGSGKAIRDWIDVRDVGAALAAIALSDVQGPVNIGTGRGVSVREMAETMAQIADRPDLLRIGALPDRDEPPSLIADTARLNAKAGFQPRFSLVHTLSASLRHARLSRSQ